MNKHTKLELDAKGRLIHVDFIDGNGSDSVPTKPGYYYKRRNALDILVHVEIPPGFRIPKFDVYALPILGDHAVMVLFRDGRGGYVVGEKVGTYPGWNMS